jgi:hypothetical protein
MRVVRVRNNTSSTKTWMNKEYSPSEEYTLPDVMVAPYSNNDVFLLAVNEGEASVGNADSWMSGAANQISWLRGDTLCVTSIPEPLPFAQPTYRTKRNAIASVVEIAVDDSEILDFQLTAERYVSGGVLIVQNPELGDYITAEVYDKDSTIPEAYRAATCENWPCVAKYIEKEFIAVEVPGSIQSGRCAVHILDTRPLNAKISAGLYLRVTYHSTNSGSARKAVVNYDISKKL